LSASESNWPSIESPPTIEDIRRSVNFAMSFATLNVCTASSLIINKSILSIEV
jgi:hypothetical protein